MLSGSDRDRYGPNQRSSGRARVDRLETGFDVRCFNRDMRRRLFTTAISMIGIVIFCKVWLALGDPFRPVARYIYRERSVSRGDSFRIIHLKGISQAKADQLLSHSLE